MLTNLPQHITGSAFPHVVSYADQCERAAVERERLLRNVDPDKPVCRRCLVENKWRDGLCVFCWDEVYMPKRDR